MSRKLKEFIELLGQSVKSRDDTDIGSYVTWLRRRVALFKHLDTETIKEIIWNSWHISGDGRHVHFQQSYSRDKSVGLQLFVVLRGSAFIYFNPFLSHGQFRRGSVSSLERVLIAAAIGDRPRSPGSVTSKRTATSRKSQICEALPEEKEDEAKISDNDMTDGEPNVNNKRFSNEEDKTIRVPTQDVSDQNRLTGVKPDNTSEKSVETRKTIDTADPPLPGGKVFVTTLPCVCKSKNVQLKNHCHVRCQMLHELPMDKVKGYNTG